MKFTWKIEEMALMAEKTKVDRLFIVVNGSSPSANANVVKINIKKIVVITKKYFCFIFVFFIFLPPLKLQNFYIVYIFFCFKILC